MSKIATDTEGIITSCETLKTAYDEVITQKEKLSQLPLQCTGPEGSSALEGITAEKYQQMHEDLTMVADTAAQLMEALIACTGNYLTGMEGFDENVAASFNTALGLDKN